MFMPLTLMVLYLVCRNWRFLPHRDLVVAVLLAVVLQSLVMALWIGWWGGMSYGPRFATALVPLFTVLGIEGSRATVARVGSPRGRRLVAVGFLTLLLVGAVINGAGAISARGMSWNAGPPRIADAPLRAFD